MNQAGLGLLDGIRKTMLSVVDSDRNVDTDKFSNLNIKFTMIHMDFHQWVNRECSHNLNPPHFLMPNYPEVVKVNNMGSLKNGTIWYGKCGVCGCVFIGVQRLRAKKMRF